MCCCCSDPCLDRLFLSKIYFLSILIQVALSTYMLGFMIKDPRGYNTNRMILLSEVLLSIMYTGDIILRLARHRFEYFLRLDNLTDFAIYCCIMTFFIWFLYEINETEGDVKQSIKEMNKSKYGPFSLIFLRYMVIIARIYTIYQRAKQTSDQISMDNKYNNIDNQQLSYNEDGGFFRNDDKLF